MMQVVEICAGQRQDIACRTVIIMPDDDLSSMGQSVGGNILFDHFIVALICATPTATFLVVNSSKY